jgi:ribosomal 50S subunit-associated protein YjgA (DUF615 family)
MNPQNAVIQPPTLQPTLLAEAKPKRRYAPKPSSKANAEKARATRMSKLQAKKDEEDLKRLTELQLKRMQAIGSLPQSAPPAPQVSAPIPIPAPQPERYARRQKTIVVDSDSDSDSDSDDEVIYVPTKKQSKKPAKNDEAENLRRELEELKKMVVKPVDPPKQEPVKQEPPKVEPQLSEYDRLQRSQLDFLRNNILKFQ